MSDSRELDVVVFGATGFTGQLAAQYLAVREGAEELRWAIAGRNEEKLAALKRELVKLSPRCENVKIMVASSEDDASLARMAAATRVVMSTVGPYIRYGEPLVRACVEQKTDYVDITGEPEFVSGILSRYDVQARDAGIRVVSCCGFDSIPHDLGVMFTLDELPKGEPVRLEGFVSASGTFSGGTWNSALDAFSRMRHQSSGGSRSRTETNGRKVGSTRMRPRYEESLGSWVAPMPTIDPQVVLRSARALNEYGPDFSYGHFVCVRSLPKLIAGGAAVAAVVALAQLPPTLALLRKVRKSGDGPGPEARAEARFRVTFLGECAGKRVRTTVSGGDPGYDETAKMVSESALCLALDRRELSPRYGVITPAEAMGRTLIARLQDRGIEFKAHPISA